MPRLKIRRATLIEENLSFEKKSFETDMCELKSRCDAKLEILTKVNVF